jgi:hypothetical protein
MLTTIIISICCGILSTFVAIFIIDKINKFNIRKFFFNDFRLNEEMAEWFLSTISTKKLLRNNKIPFTVSPTTKEANYLLKFYEQNSSSMKLQISWIKSMKANLLFDSIDKMFVVFNDFKLSSIKNHLFNRRCNFYEKDYIKEISDAKTNKGKALIISRLLLDLKFYIEYYDEFLIYMKFPKYYLKIIDKIKIEENDCEEIRNELLLLIQKGKRKNEVHIE